MIPNDRLVYGAATLRRLALPALLLGAGLLCACSDPLTAAATDTNATAPFTVHALTGSGLDFADAIYFPLRTVARVDGSFSFDVAFDINAQGDVVLLPVSVVGQNPAGGRRVGIITPAGTFDSATEAPLSGYTVDSVTVVKLGQTAIVQAQEAVCSLSPTPYYYAKLVVDSLDRPARTLFGRVLINSNCGFRSLVPGLPRF
jgi:hypothetical protein